MTPVENIFPFKRIILDFKAILTKIPPIPLDGIYKCSTINRVNGREFITDGISGILLHGDGYQ